jgi:hypothetical protein
MSNTQNKKEEGTMTYDVIRITQDGEEITIGHGATKKAAEALALEAAAKHPDDQYYITWYRKSDGQHGYLNPDGNHAITGQSWEA